MTPDEIRELKTDIWQLRVEYAIQKIRLTALTKLLELVQEKTRPGQGREMLLALRSLEQKAAHEALKTYSDYQPTLATILKQSFDKAFPDIA